MVAPAGLTLLPRVHSRPRQVLLQAVEAFPQAAAVDLELGFTRAPAADAAHEPGEGVVLAHQAGQEVFHLGHLHLELAFPAPGPLGKEVQDKLGAVNDLEFGEIGDGAHLGRG